ncbi:MAG: response regulator transcription factor [Bryobacteraceae bacterium]
MRKIALIEDDAEIYFLVKYNLEKEGFAFVGQQTGRAALEFLRREKPALVILDIALPDMDGLEICKAIRSSPDLSRVPVIFLTARAPEADRVVGLELGANDYIVKPFFMRELAARLKTQLRRPSMAPPRVLRSGSLELDHHGRMARLNGGELSLTATEFRLLEYLMSYPAVVFSREQLLDALWGEDRTATDRTVDVYILRLRQKIEPDPANPEMIRSIRGFGYSFNEARSAQAVPIVRDSGCASHTKVVEPGVNPVDLSGGVQPRKEH